VNQPCNGLLHYFSVILKDDFKEMKNDKVMMEPMVKCMSCEKKFHKICVGYLDGNFDDA
jgi:hypothetical protein